MRRRCLIACETLREGIPHTGRAQSAKQDQRLNREEHEEESQDGKLIFVLSFFCVLRSLRDSVCAFVVRPKKFSFDASRKRLLFRGAERKPSRQRGARREQA